MVGLGENSGELANTHIILLRAESVFTKAPTSTSTGNHTAQVFQFTEYINTFLPFQDISRDMLLVD
jgi:hypothetical protein